MAEVKAVSNVEMPDVYKRQLYMEGGDIREVGNHRELMVRDGLYAKLYNSQFAKENG